MRLGAILAGGRSSRFGADKALADWQGAPLIAHVAAALAPQVDALVVVGRDWGGLPSVADRPAGGEGPLAALAGALAYAVAHGHADVLTSGCDLPALPPDLAARLAPGAAIVAGQPLLGLWPTALTAALDAHLAAGHRSMRSWAAAAGARAVAWAEPIANVNTPADLAALAAGLSPSADPRSSR